jgi:hypothetical protein
MRMTPDGPSKPQGLRGAGDPRSANDRLEPLVGARPALEDLDRHHCLDEVLLHLGLECARARARDEPMKSRNRSGVAAALKRATCSRREGQPARKQGPQLRILARIAGATW